MASNKDKTAVVESATALSQELKKEMTAIVSRIAGSDVPVTFTVTPKLLGGFTIQVGDQKFDASLMSDLRQLAQRLKG